MNQNRRSTTPTPTFLALVLLALLFTAMPAVTHAQNQEFKSAEEWRKLYEPKSQPNAEMPYRLMKPLSFEAAKSYPVIVSLHGGGGKGADNNKQLKDWNRLLAEDQRRADFPTYVLAPQASELWDGNHLTKIKAIIADLPAVDMNRIYILGHSMGGHGTYILLQIDPHYFAAAAPSAGTGLKRSEPFINATTLKDIPIWAFHGSEDKVCPYIRDKELLGEMKKLNGNMKLTTWIGGNHGVSDKFIPGDNNSTTETSSDRCDNQPDFMTWLFAQTRNGSTQ